MTRFEVEFYEDRYGEEKHGDDQDVHAPDGLLVEENRDMQRNGEGCQEQQHRPVLQ